jgi:hypothetical protein
MDQIEKLLKNGRPALRAYVERNEDEIKKIPD